MLRIVLWRWRALEDSGVGSQTTTLNSADGDTVAWETKYTWANSPNNVKSCEYVSCMCGQSDKYLLVAGRPERVP